MSKFTIPPEKLRWQPAGSSLRDTSTHKAARASGIVGQDEARLALRFALTTSGHHHNAYLRGPEGSGRRTLIRSLLEELKPEPRRSQDFCYVHNFANPDRPRLIVLAGGQGRQFQHAMTRISLFVRDRLPEILKNDPIRSRREARKEAAEREIRLKVKPLENKLKGDGLALMRTQSGPTSRVSIYPLVMGKPVSPEEYRNLVTQGQAREEERLESLKKAESWQAEVNRVAHEVNQIWQQANQHIDQINATETARILGEMTAEVGRRFKANGMDVFLREIIDDIVEKRVGRDTSHLAEPTLLYGVNVLTARPDRQNAPVVYASQPSVANLFGTIDPAWMSSGRAVTSFRGIRTGALLEADGGFLVLDAADVLDEPGCWRMLMRALRTGLSEVVPPELGWPYSAQSLKPEPIPVQLRVLLTGDQATFDRLAAEDRDFEHLFRVLVDFDHSLARDQEGIDGYVRFMAGLVERESLPHLDQSAIEAVIEHGARLSPEKGRLSSCFGVLADLLREAAQLARDEGENEIARAQIEHALELKRTRHGLALKRLLREFNTGGSEIRLRGRADGIVLAATATHSAGHVQGLPCPIKAAVSPDRITEVLIDGRADDGGMVLALTRLLHLGSVPGLRALLQSVKPAEARADAVQDRGLDLACMSALLGSLAVAGLRQDLCLIGCVDAQGQVLPVSHINERIEAFFELCRQAGLSGQQAVVIPRASQNELMLGSELVKACANDMFQVYAVDNAIQAAELATGMKAGLWKDGAFSENSLLGRARAALTG